jgi:sec-independent protein translocase protein TatC
MSTQQALITHLIELRIRVTHALAAMLLVFICLFPWASDLYALLAQPLLSRMPHGTQMIATDVTTPFFVPIKVAMMAAFLISLPYTLLQIWKFVAPGLYANEKRFLLPMIVMIFPFI